MMVAIPECNNVNLSFQVLQEQVLDNYNIYPVPNQQVITNPDSTCYVAEVFCKNTLCYADNMVSPSNNVELTETGYFRSQKYADIQVSPIRYNPATQKLYVATEIEVVLTLTNASGATSANLPFDKGIGANRSSYGEFYSYNGWEDPNNGSGIRHLVRFTEHGKKVELPYSYLIDEPDVMGIDNFFTDATPGVIYNKDDGEGQTNKLYRSMDYGYTWEAIDDLSAFSDMYWTFKNAPGVLLKRNIDPLELRISYDYGSHFESLDIPAFEGYSESGWNVGELFGRHQSYEMPSYYYLTHSMDFNQSADTVFCSNSDYFEMMAGPNEGELYTYYPSYDDPNYYTMSYKLFFSPDFGQHQQMLMTVDSLIIGDMFVSDYWEFWADNEPGVFYSIKKESSNILANSGKVWIDYYRNYGNTLVTTYFHHFRPNWYSQHSPVMDCEVAGYDENSVTLRWSEPELRPEEVLVGYQIYRGETLIGDNLNGETEYTDLYLGEGKLKYHILAVYSDGQVSKSYNIVYCDQTENIHENDAENTITISPNPANGIVHISGMEVAEIRICNILGQTIKTCQNTNEISVSNLPAGLYLLRLTDSKGTTATERLVVN